jgi:hypothetical protein
MTASAFETEAASRCHSAVPSAARTPGSASFSIAANTTSKTFPAVGFESASLMPK